MILIGIMGSKGKSRIIDILKEELYKNGKESVVIGTHDDSADAFEKLLFKEVEYVLISISREDLLEDRLNNISFNVIINIGYIDESNLFRNKVKELLDRINENGYYIFNADNVPAIDTDTEFYPLSFGLNDKATVTATSIDDLTCLCFSFCLQRTIVTFEKEVIQPFEKLYQVSGKYSEIYYYLAALTCMLIIGIKL
ncbi:hypothetical protein ABG79_01031 [Caloramator mitchellensis]|uniref:Mur ligase middle domain protein n=1 Tax=Caloramator mitchellensis TaxID=908809 RepID=A0A0R3K1U2_CALMK|nr:hypothetical protein [Caloramator mitchellensis]KRQ87228.1 hypothetical protein ABG79_01031 [Caloramator mitchellensis]